MEPSVGGKYNLRDVDLPSTAGRASVQNYLFFKHEASMAVAESARAHTHTHSALTILNALLTEGGIRLKQRSPHLLSNCRNDGRW